MQRASGPPPLHFGMGESLLQPAARDGAECSLPAAAPSAGVEEGATASLGADDDGPLWRAFASAEAPLLAGIMLREGQAVQAVEAFLKRHPPSVTGDATPDDILG